jgi:protein TonB
MAGMGASVRKLVVFGTIAALHAAAIYGLAQVRTQLQEASPQKPIEVKTTSPTISIDPPDVPVIDVPIVEESLRAIAVPVQASAPVASDSDRHAPKLVSTVEYVREPAPRYPPQSRKLREQGLVMLRVLIDEKGNACSIEIESSSGYARLDHAAREAVARAAFRPYVEDGEPRRAVVLIPIEFYLNRTSA